jgi:hypothetical protein
MNTHNVNHFLQLPNDLKYYTISFVFRFFLGLDGLLSLNVIQKLLTDVIELNWWFHHVKNYFFAIENCVTLFLILNQIHTNVEITLIANNVIWFFW